MALRQDALRLRAAAHDWRCSRTGCELFVSSLVVNVVFMV
jgi:hypothetical protein